MPDLKQVRTPVKPPTRPTTLSKSPLLKSDIRAQDRQKFDDIIKFKQEELDK